MDIQKIDSIIYLLNEIEISINAIKKSFQVEKTINELKEELKEPLEEDEEIYREEEPYDEEIDLSKPIKKLPKTIININPSEQIEEPIIQEKQEPKIKEEEITLESDKLIIPKRCDKCNTKLKKNKVHFINNFLIQSLYCKKCDTTKIFKLPVQ